MWVGGWVGDCARLALELMFEGGAGALLEGKGWWYRCGWGGGYSKGAEDAEEYWEPRAPLPLRGSWSGGDAELYTVSETDIDGEIDGEEGGAGTGIWCGCGW